MTLQLITLPGQKSFLLFPYLNSAADEEPAIRHLLMVYNPNPREWSGSDSIKGKYNLKAYQGQHKKLLDGLTYLVREEFEDVGRPCSRVLLPVTFRRIRVVPGTGPL